MDDPLHHWWMSTKLLGENGVKTMDLLCHNYKNYTVSFIHGMQVIIFQHTGFRNLLGRITPDPEGQGSS